MKIKISYFFWKTLKELTVKSYFLSGKKGLKFGKILLSTIVIAVEGINCQNKNVLYITRSTELKDLSVQ